MGEDNYKVYWASPIFTKAERSFNDKCVGRLREEGFTVYSPQEIDINEDDYSPTASEVFRVDTDELLDCDVLVSCIDSKVIDSGVACEMGIAYSEGISVVGLYTDFRQHREGRGRMYKNLYTVGLLEDSGGIVSDLDELVERLDEIL
jgi:nucleoside 2-deoxyribosyltransferase